MWSTLRSTPFRSMGAMRSIMLTRFPAAVPLLFSSFLLYMSNGKRSPATRALGSSASFFLFWQQRLALFSFVAGVAFASLCLQLAVLFSVLVQT